MSRAARLIQTGPLPSGLEAFPFPILLADGADHRHRRRLRSRHERPRRSSKQPTNKLPPLHSMTSSARASTDDGMSRPSALAVLRLITSSYLPGACTGRSAGYSQVIGLNECAEKP